MSWGRAPWPPCVTAWRLHPRSLTWTCQATSWGMRGPHTCVRVHNQILCKIDHHCSGAHDGLRIVCSVVALPTCYCSLRAARGLHTGSCMHAGTGPMVSRAWPSCKCVECQAENRNAHTVASYRPCSCSWTWLITCAFAYAACQSSEEEQEHGGAAACGV